MIKQPQQSIFLLRRLSASPINTRKAGNGLWVIIWIATETVKPFKRRPLEFSDIAVGLFWSPEPNDHRVHLSQIHAAGASTFQCKAIDFAVSKRLSTAFLGEGTMFKEAKEPYFTSSILNVSSETRFFIFQTENVKWIACMLETDLNVMWKECV